MSVNEALLSEELSQSEKLVIMWQFGLHGDFHTALWNAIARADEKNLARLELGFPHEIAGYRAWAFSDPYPLGEKLRQMGLLI